MSNGNITVNAANIVSPVGSSSPPTYRQNLEKGGFSPNQAGQVSFARAKKAEALLQEVTLLEETDFTPNESEISPEKMTSLVAKVRAHVREAVPELDFSIDEDTEKLVVKVVDTTTGDIVRQIPSEEIIHIAKMLDKLQGLLYRGRA